MREAQVFMHPSLRDAVDSGQLHPVTGFRCNRGMREPPKNTVAGRIHERMTAMHLNQAELAGRARIPATTLSGILHRTQHNISQDALYGISKALNTSMEWLTVGDGEEDVDNGLKFLLSKPEFELIQKFRDMTAAQRVSLKSWLEGAASSKRKRSSRPFRESRDGTLRMKDRSG